MKPKNQHFRTYQPKMAKCTIHCKPTTTKFKLLKKTKKQIRLENDLTMPAITAEFHTYKTGAEKAKYLREMGQLNLPYDVNWENLAQCYEGAKSWPSINYTKKALEEKDENN